MDGITFSLIGYGNAAHHFARMLTSSGNKLLEVCGRDLHKAEALATRYQAKAIDDPAKLSPETELVIIAVNDDAIASVSATLKEHFFVAHTSGAAPLDILRQSQRAVLWPLMSLTMGKDTAYKEMPLMIEASGAAELKALKDLFSRVTDLVYTVTGEQRLRAHVAAVFANNFVNHLYAAAADILRREQLPFEILLPIIREETEKIQKLTPEDAQTGPARRGDMKTIGMHLKTLETASEKEIYSVLTNAILEKYHDQKL